MFAPVYTTGQVRELEQAALRLPQVPEPRLMERAGLAAAEYARSTTGDTARRVLVVAGPGNNGGDAFEVAVHLKQWFYRVTAVFVGDRSKLSGDAGAALAKWKAAGGMSQKTIPTRGPRGPGIQGPLGR